MKQQFMLISMLAVASSLLAFSIAIAGDINPDPEAVSTGTSDSVMASSFSIDEQELVVYYFHGNQRCVTCKKLEAYSFEALHDNFKSALEDSSIVWRVVNFEAEGNEHYVEDYKLFTQSLILSRVVEGKEVEWKNLDKIWQLVGDKAKFLAYVKTETQDFLSATPE